MIAPLDVIAEWLQRVLGMFSPNTAGVVFIPAFVLVVVIGSVLAVRKLLLPLSCLAVALIRWAVTLVGVLMLLLEMAVATIYRRRSARPPAVLYLFGDSVAAWADRLHAGLQRAVTAVTRLTRVNVVLLIVLATGWLWVWNYEHCPDPAAGCARPFATWYQSAIKG